MRRTTISIDDSLSENLDEMARLRGYVSRSEAVRDLVRDGLERWRSETASSTHCVANLSYVVDRRVRQLPQHIAEMQHTHHDLVIASTVVRLDHFHSLEIVILKGRTPAVRTFAERVRAERGVRLASLNMLEVVPTDEHLPNEDHQHPGHQHLSPLN